MLYVLEGCDGVGKTTISKQIVAKIRELGGAPEEIHFDSDMTKNTFERFKELCLKSTVKDIVCDRFCFGQFVYQTEEERAMTYEQLDELCELLDTVGATVILVEAPAELIQQRMIKRGEQPYTLERIEEIKSKFKIYVTQTTCVIIEGTN